MPRTRRWYRLEVGRLQALLERLSLKDGLLLWEALGEGLLAPLVKRWQGKGGKA